MRRVIAPAKGTSWRGAREVSGCAPHPVRPLQDAPDAAGMQETDRLLPAGWRQGGTWKPETLR